MSTSRKRLRKRKRNLPGTPQTNLKRGDSVVVKPGVLDPDFGIDVGGWQGKILEEPDEESLVLIGWDSVTLRNMPASVIEQSAERGLDWAQMRLKVQQVELASPRDTAKDVAKATRELSKKYAWSFLGEEGRRVNKILAGVDSYNDLKAFRAWKKHLAQHLVFPFEAEVAEFQDRGPLQAGDRVTVQGISDVDDFYGIIVSMTHRRRQYDFPLCDLKVTDKNSLNYQPVDDYSVWFANR